jgi:hypothetical protein
MKGLLFYDQILVKAGQTVPVKRSGVVFQCKGCSIPAPGVTVSFDEGQTNNPLSPGATLNLSLSIGAQKSFNSLLFTNTSATDALVSYFIGTIAVTFNPSDSRAASTYIKGNLGLNANGNYIAGGISQAIATLNSSGTNNVTKIAVTGVPIVIFGNDAGHQRKTIIFSGVISGTVAILDANGNFGTTVPTSSTGAIAFDSDAVMQIVCTSGAPAYINIMEEYYAQP